MSKSTLAKHERAIRWEAQKKNKIALDTLRALVYADMKPMVEAQILKAKEGDTKAFDSLLDRAFGKAKENLEISGDVKFSLSSLAQQWEERRKLPQDEQDHVTPGISSLLEENPATDHLDDE